MVATPRHTEMAQNYMKLMSEITTPESQIWLLWWKPACSFIQASSSRTWTQKFHNRRISSQSEDWTPLVWCILYVSRHLYLTFRSLEDSEVLNPDNDVHRLSLHILFSSTLDRKHAHNIATDSTAVNNVFGENPYSNQNTEAILALYGIQTLPTLDDEEFPAVTVEPPQLILSQQQQASVHNAVQHISDLKINIRLAVLQLSVFYRLRCELLKFKAQGLNLIHCILSRTEKDFGFQQTLQILH